MTDSTPSPVSGESARMQCETMAGIEYHVSYAGDARCQCGKAPGYAPAPASSVVGDGGEAERLARFGALLIAVQNTSHECGAHDASDEDETYEEVFARSKNADAEAWSFFREVLAELRSTRAALEDARADAAHWKSMAEAVAKHADELRASESPRP